MEIVILLALILVNGAFSMSEIAVVTARKGRLKALGEGGDRAAGAALRLGEDPDHFLSTVQVGITTIGLLNGIVGESALAPPLAQALAGAGIDERIAGYAASVIAIAAITYLSIVLGELVPKRLGQLNPEGVARRVARPMQWLSSLCRPFVWLLAHSTRLVLALLGIRDQGGKGVTREEIHAVLTEGADAGVIGKGEHAMLNNVFRLDQRQIGSLMVPRSDVVYLDADASWETNRDRIVGSEHSRFPVVVGGRLKETLGVITARQLLAAAFRGERPDLRNGLRPPVFVPENLTGRELLQNMKESHVQLAFVVDEYGEVQGIVTATDVLEAITGELAPGTAQERRAVCRPDGSWLLDGVLPVPELKDALGIRAVPEESRYHTLAGMLMLVLGRLPHTGDQVRWEGWRLEVIDMDGKRIDKVLAARE
jgi:putative hemolysin